MQQQVHIAFTFEVYNTKKSPPLPQLYEWDHVENLYVHQGHLFATLYCGLKH